MKNKAHIVSHTHWDREWYLPLEKFRIKLVDLFDHLLALLDRDSEYASFMLDGQSVLIEDYLAVKPYNREKIQAHVQSGRLVIGPWYVLPDELLISGEAHIRNFLEGQAVCASFGTSQMIGYLPDAFGHPSQMPQILAGLGLETAVFWRGMTPKIAHSEFQWYAPSGTRVFSVFMPRGYGNMVRIPSDIKRAVPHVEETVRALAAQSRSHVVLLMNGLDHMEAQEDLTQILKELNGQLTDCTVEHSTLSAYVQEVRPALSELESHVGELRFAHHSFLLGGTLSARMMLKQRNFQVQRQMERYLEPLCVMAAQQGADYPVDLLRHNWKSILRNHPHDSICGCSTDEVHSAMQARYNALSESQDFLQARAFGHLADAMERTQPHDAFAALYNPSSQPYSGYVEIDVDFDRCLLREMDLETVALVGYEDAVVMPPAPVGVTVTDAAGRTVPAVLLSQETHSFLDCDGTPPKLYKANRCRIGLSVTELAPMGLTGLYIQKSDAASPAVAESEDAVIRNAFFTVSVNPDGTLRIQDEAGTVWDRQHGFRDGGDAGDEYTYSCPEQDALYAMEPDSVCVRKKACPAQWETLEITGVLNLPAALRADRKARGETMCACPVLVEVTLYEGVRRIDITTAVTNNARDHRLQVTFPLGAVAEVSEAQMPFHVTPRPIVPEADTSACEAPPTCHPFQGFVNVSGPDRGLMLAARGLSEYETWQEPDTSVLALTLLRCVGWMSRGDLPTRKGHAGWALETPQAQCLGTHRFSYCLIPHVHTWQEDNLLTLSDQFIAPPVGKQSFAQAKDKQPDVYAFVSDLPACWQISAVKQAEDGRGIIVRVVNMSGERMTGAVRFKERVVFVTRTSLAEKDEGGLSLKDNAVVMKMRPWQIQSVRVCFME